MGPPRKGQLKLLQAWLLDPNAKGGGNFLSDVELTTWLESFKPDHYISLNPNLAEDDVFTNTMMNFVIPKLHECFGEKGGYVSYKDSTIVKFSNILVTILASIIPPITILLLNALHTTIERIIVTIAFTAVFAIVLACLTSAKRVEILAATAT